MSGSGLRWMKLLQTTANARRLFGALLVAILTTAGCGGGGGSPPPISTSTPTALPTPVPTQIAGPGLLSEIIDVSIPADPAGQVNVLFTVTDQNGIPLTATTTTAGTHQTATGAS